MPPYARRLPRPSTNGRQRAFVLRPSSFAPVLAVVVALLAPALAAGAQTAEPDALTLFVRRNFGYGGGSQIQGSFRMEIQGPADLVSVTFRVDETVVGTDTEPPFRVDFNTDDYAPGWHAMTAVGQTADGRTLTSAPRRLEFLSAADSQAATLRVVGVMGGIVVVVMLAVFGLSLLPTLAGRRKTLPAGAPRDYGLLGGAICPRCGRPFPRHWWALNVSFVGRFDRCDHCGKWSMTTRASPEALRAAEAAELAAAAPEAPTPELSPEEKLRRQLDDSRYSG